MPGRVIELASDGARLGVSRGFLTVSRDGTGGRSGTGGSGRIPLADVTAVIASAQALSYSNAALSALADRGAPLVICGRDYAPTSVLLPLTGHYEQGVRMVAQAQASLPTQKRVWATLVRAKIAAQAAVLDRRGAAAAATRLRRLAATVRSGDPDNREAQAAQAYWPALMGSDFRRKREGDGANPFLNYGYAVLRAATARTVAAVGLNPSLSVHHQSRGDPLRLADDLMEPFRPAVDLIVADLTADGTVPPLDPETKAALVAVLDADYRTDVGRTPLSLCVHRLANSLAAIFLKTRKTLDLPLDPLPLTADAAATLPDLEEDRAGNRNAGHDPDADPWPAPI